MQRSLLKFRDTFDKRIFLVILGVFVVLAAYAVSHPQKTRGALVNATATLSNPRLSYKGVVAVGTSASTLIEINGSTSNPDHDTYALMPNDATCFAPDTLVGCRDDTAYTVVGIGTSLTYNVDPALTTSLTAGDFAISTQSGTLSLNFTLGSAIPSDGDILITIPMADDEVGDDGFPDSNSTTTTSGFDLGESGGNKITTGDVTVTESCSGTFSVTSVNVGSGSSTDNTIVISNSAGSCESSSTLTIGIGSTANGHLLINPAPISGSRTRGEADTYTINIKTRDGSGNSLDNTNVMVAPVEAVLVSATVQELLTFRVCGVQTDLSTQEATCFSTPGTICGLGSLDVSTHAYSVPFGTLTQADHFYNAAQYMYVSTNAANGYSVKIQQDDQMSKDGAGCTGNPTDPVTTNCIPDNPGDGSLDFNTSDDCDTDATNGLCYSLDSGPAAGEPTFALKYNVSTDSCDGSPTFCARAAADQEPVPAETPQTIISNSTAVSTRDAFVCWRLSVDTLQPAGYYYNKVKYTAVPIF